MRMDEIGWHSVHGADFINEREHGAGDWVFLLMKSEVVTRERGGERGPGVRDRETRG